MATQNVVTVDNDPAAEQKTNVTAAKQEEPMAWSDWQPEQQASTAEELQNLKNRCANLEEHVARLFRLVNMLNDAGQSTTKVLLDMVKPSKASQALQERFGSLGAEPEAADEN